MDVFLIVCGQFWSITGLGISQSLEIMQDYMPLNVTEVPTGAKVFDLGSAARMGLRKGFLKDGR